MINKLKVFYNEYISITLIIILIGITSAVGMNWILYNGIPGVETSISRDGWTSFSGAFIGGALTLIGVNMTISNETRRRRNEEKPIIVLSKKSRTNDAFFCFSIFKVTKEFILGDFEDRYEFKFFMEDFQIENIGKNPIFKIHVKFIFSNGEIHEIVENGLIKSNEILLKKDVFYLKKNDIVLREIIFKVYDVYNNMYSTEITCECESNQQILKIKRINYNKVSEKIH